MSKGPDYCQSADFFALCTVVPVCAQSPWAVFRIRNGSISQRCSGFCLLVMAFEQQIHIPNSF